MTQSELESFTAALDNVQRDDSYGYSMYFVGDDHMVPFVSFINADNEYDAVSNLNREGVFRVNIGVGRELYDELIGDTSPENVDFTELNVFLPHPHYAKQHFLCILNPEGVNENIVLEAIADAHSLASARLARKVK